MLESFLDYQLTLSEGGVLVTKEGRPLYRNNLPIQLYIKSASTQAQSYAAAYTQVEETADALLASGEIKSNAGSAFRFTDTYTVTEEGIAVDRKVEVLTAGDDLGFASAISLAPVQSDDVADYEYFAPGFWYRDNRFAPDRCMGVDMDCEYFWFWETHCGLPVFSMFHPESKEVVSMSRLRSDVQLRRADVKFSENSVDPLLNIGALGMHKAKDHSLNYTYYGYGVQHDWKKQQGLFIDYVFPASEGETPRPMHYGGLDFKSKARNFQRTYHPIDTTFTQNYGVLINFSTQEDIQQVIRHSWRNNYDRLRDNLFSVDNVKFFRDSIEIFNRFTRQYGDSWGLPFACQLPDMDVNSVAFQFGFVGQQPGIGYQLLRQGCEEGNEELYNKGMNILEFWVREAKTENGLIPSCYSPVMEGFEPYPFYLRMMADGLEAIQSGYMYLRRKGIDKPAWLAFLQKTADCLVQLQAEDGSFCRAYYADGSIRMDSKSNTPSVIRFFIEMYLITGVEAYRTAAEKAGAWSYDNAYRNLEYRGGTCDNLDIQDKEAGIYAMWGFMALYDLTHDDHWLEAAKGAADYTETWTYAWNFPIRTPWPIHPFNKYGISGQSVITVGGGADVYMAACSYTYYRMYLLTGDKHYLDFATFLHKNTRQATDVDGSIGYCMPALGHESGGFIFQDMMSNYHWLPWCTFVAVEPTARLKDTFGVYEIEEAEKLPMEERLARNDLYAYYTK